MVLHIAGLRGVPEKRRTTMRQNKKNQVIGDVVSNFGFAFEVFKVIAHAVMAKGGDMQHLRRIVKEPALQQQIADLIVSASAEATAGRPADSEIEHPLGENEFLVYVDYDMPRDKVELEAKFCKGGVADCFYGDYEWQLHSSCTKIDQMPGKRIMLIKHFGRETTSEENIAEMDKLGYRPATHLEAYAFAKANPEQQMKFWIIALGSYVRYPAGRYVAALYHSGYEDRRTFTYDYLDGEWGACQRFLFVRK